jgi:hypothetical protein
MIINTYNLEYNRFINYITSDLYSQGIADFNYDMLKIYEDYLRMQIGLYGKVREKYSKHLKTDHDKISLKNSEYSKHKQDLLMFNIAEYQRKLEYRSGKYIIRIPETSMEVVDEGVDLCHCVASYVEDIVKGQTLIVFLRDKNEPDESLVTIEVCNEEIKQVQGFCRRLPHEDENLFIKEWAKKKNLICNYPGRIEE